MCQITWFQQRTNGQTVLIQLLMLKKCPSPKHTGWAIFLSRLSRTVTEWNIYYKQGCLCSKILMSMYSRRLHSILVMKQVLRYLIASIGTFSDNLCTTKWLCEYATTANCSKTWCEKCTNILHKQNNCLEQQVVPY